MTVAVEVEFSGTLKSPVPNVEIVEQMPRGAGEKRKLGKASLN